MKKKTLLTLAIIGIGTLFAASANAGWSFGLSIGGPAYVPAPVIVAPPVLPPPVIYRPRVVRPPRVVYAPAYCAPRGYAWGRYEHHDRDDRHEWRHENHDNRWGGHDSHDRGGWRH